MSATAAGRADRGTSEATRGMLESTPARGRLARDGGAYIHLMTDEELERDLACSTVQLGSAPLSGWTLAVKDLIAVRGRPLGAGSAVRAGGVPEQADAPIVAMLRRVGAVVVGTTALHELAFGVTGVNAYCGTPANPLEPGCIPGGSSSGSAVAVADGSARIALGTDTGGSARIPAALCGVVGFKPSYGTYPIAGVLPLAPSLDHVGLLARSVVDVCSVHASFGHRVHPRRTPLRVALAKSELEVAEPGVAKAIELALDLASREGCQIVEAEWPEQERVLAASTTIMFAEAAHLHRQTLASSPALLGADVRARLEAGAAIDAATIAEARRERELLRQAVSRTLGEFDCVVGPTVGDFPPSLADSAVPEVAGRLVANTRLANLVGIPAISVPVPGDGPPVGLQVTSLTNGAALGAAEWIERTLSGICLSCRRGR